MKYNNDTGMLPKNDSAFEKKGPLAESIQRVQSFAFLEEDEDLMPVANQEIERAIVVLEDIYTKTKLVPFHVVPTRSGGVGLEYRIEDADAYYHFDPNGRMDFSLARGNVMLKHSFFTSLDEIPNPLDAI